jgi:hypothetical protein
MAKKLSQTDEWTGLTIEHILLETILSSFFPGVRKCKILKIPQKFLKAFQNSPKQQNSEYFGLPHPESISRVTYPKSKTWIPFSRTSSYTENFSV